MSGSGKFRNKTNSTNKHDIDALSYCGLKSLDDTKEKVNAGNRILIVPNREPIDRPAVIKHSELNRLKKEAEVVSLEDRKRFAVEREREKFRLITESSLRKESLLRLNNAQKVSGESGSEIVESETTKASHVLLERSQELKMEEEQRVKEANAIILSAKCRAIRNVQIAEKKMIEKETKDEDRRLDNMMEQQRQKKIDIENKKLEQEQIKKLRYTKDIKQQMKENELERLLETERIEEESRMLNKALIELQKEDERKANEKREIQYKIREEFRKANVEAQRFKDIKAEEQRICDLRIQEFMRQKVEREEALEKEKASIRAAKEREIARLRETAEKSQDLQATLDELNAQRAQDEKERQWREKEKQAAIKKQRIIEDMQAARTKQVEDIRKTQAIAIARDEEDFKKVAKVQQELHQKELDKIAFRKQEAAKHCKELLKQINEKERERINWRMERFEDGKAQRMEFALQDKNIEDYLKYKLEKLKQNLPQQYINDIERQLQIGEN